MPGLPLYIWGITASLWAITVLACMLRACVDKLSGKSREHKIKVATALPLRTQPPLPLPERCMFVADSLALPPPYPPFHLPLPSQKNVNRDERRGEKGMPMTAAAALATSPLAGGREVAVLPTPNQRESLENRHVPRKAFQIGKLVSVQQRMETRKGVLRIDGND